MRFLFLSSRRGRGWGHFLSTLSNHRRMRTSAVFLGLQGEEEEDGAACFTENVLHEVLFDDLTTQFTEIL